MPGTKTLGFNKNSKITAVKSFVTLVTAWSAICSVNMAYFHLLFQMFAQNLTGLSKQERERESACACACECVRERERENCRRLATYFVEKMHQAGGKRI
jgi:hypothetical protein